MGVIELAHFVFPLMTGTPYGYFPGMATAGPLSAAGLWGIVRMTKANRRLARKQLQTSDVAALSVMERL